ncbi:P16 [Goji berry chlorosis virus]|nr:P16 [Goji berry chlorosis virus]
MDKPQDLKVQLGNILYLLTQIYESLEFDIGDQPSDGNPRVKTSDVACGSLPTPTNFDTVSQPSDGGTDLGNSGALCVRSPTMPPTPPGYFRTILNKISQTKGHLTFSTTKTPLGYSVVINDVFYGPYNVFKKKVAEEKACQEYLVSIGVLK